MFKGWGLAYILRSFAAFRNLQWSHWIGNCGAFCAAWNRDLAGEGYGGMDVTMHSHWRWKWASIWPAPSLLSPFPITCPVSYGECELRACPYFWTKEKWIEGGPWSSRKRDWSLNQTQIRKSWDWGINCCINLAVLPLPRRELIMAAVS